MKYVVYPFFSMALGLAATLLFGLCTDATIYPDTFAAVAVIFCLAGCAALNPSVAFVASAVPAVILLVFALAVLNRDTYGLTENLLVFILAMLALPLIFGPQIAQRWRRQSHPVAHV